jgi:inner membrane protein
MDSLTQIVLGAACGEIVLGKKIGNKALLFGAIGGTIPDLDVFVGRWLYSNEIQAMAFHRGFMHSILFAVLVAFFFGWLTYKLYNTGVRVGSTNQKN